MPLNPQVQALLAMFASMPPVDYATITPEALRALNDNPMQMGPPPAVASVRDVEIALPGRTLAGRLYVPEGAGENPPLVVFYHGGGWVIGTIETHDGTCRALARASGAAVLSVGYRLAPEAPFPAPLDDCVEALDWAHANAGSLGVDGSRLAVAGDSAGGNLAAAVAHRLRGSGVRVLGQVLIYPALGGDMGTGSHVTHADAPMLTLADVEYYAGIRHPGGRPPANDPTALPLQDSDFTDLPPTVALAAECDPLADDAHAYAARITAAGGQALARTESGLVHGYLRARRTDPQAGASFSRIIAAIAALAQGASPDRIAEPDQWSKT